ncbi:MAG: WecB/TagA/CpsF family glycosyltransferase, partial [bacterium]|nr:WecB/TagA/CpsF family glycosyltransferase [bacterium]
MNENSILGIAFDDYSQKELQHRLTMCLDGTRQCIIVTPNPEMLMASQKDAVFASILRQADIRSPDAIGVMYASAALHDAPITHRHSGIELLWMLAELCAKNGKRVLLVGGRTGVAEHAAIKLRAKYPMLDVRGVNPGIVRIKVDQVV